jgi:NAD(P)-dependent dehydrogenase (short-subunit alcohol dehydrogenase family)
MERILITGANRGIGLELVRQYLQRRDTQVFATCRNPQSATTLNQLVNTNRDRAHVIQLDVADQSSIEASVRAVSAQVDGLDVLINNAGINPGTDRERTFGKLEMDAILHVLHVNSVAPIMVAQAYAGLLRAGSNVRLVNVSSGAGSLERQANGCGYTYNASKAALNMMTRCLSGTLGSDNIAVIALNPGWVKTDMGGPNANLEPEVSITGIIKLVDGLTMTDNGQFFNWDGGQIPW